MIKSVKQSVTFFFSSLRVRHKLNGGRKSKEHFAEHTYMIFPKLFQVLPKFFMLWAISKFVSF